MIGKLESYSSILLFKELQVTEKDQELARVEGALHFFTNVAVCEDILR